MSFTKSVTLPVSPDEAFALVTQPDRLRRWQTVSAYVDLRAGGAYRWTVAPGQVAVGTFREVDPGKRVVFGFGWEGNDDLKPDASIVTVTVEPDGDGSKVTLVHEGLDEQQLASHAEGWNHYLERLEKLATTGDAGQDEWAWAPENLTPLIAAEAALAVIQPVLRNLTPRTARSRRRARTSPATSSPSTFGSLVQIGAMAGAAVVNPEEGSLENRISVMAAQAIDAWRAVDLEGTVPGPGGSEMPAAFAASILPIEILLHGWDIAQSSGQTLRVSDELVAYVRTLAEAVVPGGRARGSFADEVTPAPGASPLDQLAAFAGRTPLAA